MAKADLTAARLREVVHYNDQTGEFTRLVTISAKALAGAKAGCKTRSCPYVRIGIDGYNYRAHRLAFLWMTGAWPSLHIDHIDGNPKNNAWSNLRDVSRAINLQNIHKARSDSTSGFIGASRTPSGRWTARITANGHKRHLGNFMSAEDASAAYLAAKAQLHPDAPIARNAGPAPARASIDGVSGMRGVYPHHNKWVARLYVERKPKHLGSFDTPEAAHLAYLDAKARHGKAAKA